MVTGKHCQKAIQSQVPDSEIFFKPWYNQTITAEGRTPPSAEYNANLPTGIPIP